VAGDARHQGNGESRASFSLPSRHGREGKSPSVITMCEKLDLANGSMRRADRCLCNRSTYASKFFAESTANSTVVTRLPFAGHDPIQQAEHADCCKTPRRTLANPIPPNAFPRRTPSLRSES